MTYLNKNNLGFTLVETMVAIAILLVAVVTPISLIGNALHNLYYAKDQVIAINLAQEGIETIRQRRDSNFLAGNTWTNNIMSGPYIYDAVTNNLTPVNTDIEVYEDSNGYYTQGVVGQTVTPFKRTISNSVSGDEMTVTCQVDWTTGNAPGSIVVSEHLFNWLK